MNYSQTISLSTDATRPGGLTATIVSSSDGQAVGMTAGVARGARYQELNEIDRGGCGHILRAFDSQLEREVVIKKILPHVRSVRNIEARFLHEARITARLAHPGIVPVHEFGYDDAHGSPFYSMKWLHGETLTKIIGLHHALPAGRQKDRSRRHLLKRFQQVCQTLAYAHQQGVIHRDLKPANVLVAEYGETVVLDWGIAKDLNAARDATHAHDPAHGHPSEQSPPAQPNERPYGAKTEQKSDGASELTVAGSILGTASYMSPEQARGESSQIDRRSDVFSLGVILYEILTGVSPFRAETMEKTLDRVARIEYVPVRDVAPGAPRALAAVCHKALSPKPQLRYCDASELEKEIESYLAGDRVSAYAEPWWAKLDRLASKYRTIFWSALLSLLVVAAISLCAATSIHQAHQSEKAARALAEREHQDKTTALQREQVAHREAITQLQSAREAVDGWLLDLNGDLGLYPGLSALRMQLLDRAEKHYSVLAEQPADTPLMQLEVARAVIRLGDIERARTKCEEARVHYATAIAQLEELLRLDRSDWWAVVLVQLAKARIGLAWTELNPSGKAEGALAIARQVADSMSSISADSPEYRQAQKTASQAMHVGSAAQFELGQGSKAEADVIKAIAIWDFALAGEPLGHELRASIAMLEDLARYQFEQKKYEVAREAYQRVVHVFDRLLTNGDERPDWLESRAIAKTRVAACNLQLVHPNEAVMALESAEEDLRRAWQLFGGEGLFHDKVSHVYSGLGQAFLLAGEFHQAERALKQSVESLDWLARHRGETTEHIQRVAQNLLWLVTAIEHQSSGEVAKFLKGTERLLEKMNQSETDANPNARMQAHHDWLVCRQHIRHEAFDEALGTATEGIANLERVEQKQATQGYWHLYRGRLWACIGRVYALQGFQEESRQAIASARADLQSARANPDKYRATAASFSLLESWCEGEELIESDRLQAMELARRMVADHETLPSAWYWLCETSLKCGLLDNARDAMSKLQRIRRRATVEDELLRCLLSLRSGDSTEETLRRCREELAAQQAIGTHAAFLQEQLSEMIEQHSGAKLRQ